MNKKQEQSEHEFAFYFPMMHNIIAQAAHETQSYELADEQLCHRIVHILRLQEKESFILFDATHNAHCTIVKLGKRVGINCDELIVNKKLTPPITFLLPILKREAFEEAIYSLTELGATTIQPVVTAKTHRQLNNAKEFERLERIIWAAAEQSKNFAMPTLEQPIEFNKLHTIPIQNNSLRLFFDPEGAPINSIITGITQHSAITVMIGPEGDLTSEEKAQLKEQGFTFCALTPTILRAQQAAAVVTGLMRSFSVL